MTLPPFPRRHDLDALRAFAMLLGIALHASLSFLAFPWIVQDTQQSDVFWLLFLPVHGFRMPLFFVVSGFFTAMLWRRHGLKSLLKQRTLRVFVPCMLGLITIVPAMNWVIGRAVESERKGDKPAEPGQVVDAGFFTTIATGDLEKIQGRLASGSDPNARHPDSGGTILTWAALLGKRDVVALLIDKGARVNDTEPDGGTALHAAAFFGRADVVELLIAHEANIDARNLKGETSLDAASVDWGATLLIAGLLQVPLNEQQVRRGRARCIELLGGPAAKPFNENPLDEEKSAGLRAGYAALITSDRLNVQYDGEEPFNLVHTPVFHHLWFLWFLCWLVPLFAIAAWIADRIGWKGPPRWWVLSPARFLWLIPMTMVPQWFMGVLVPSFGPDTSAGLLPQPHLLAYYGVFFGFGALYFDCDDREGRLGRWWWLALPLALCVALPVGLATSIAPGFRTVSALAQVVYAWAMTFGLMGLFRRVLSGESKLLRYVSDSSYWLYVAHLPLVIAAQAFLREWPLAAVAKFILVCTVVSGFLLLTYEYLVRYTPIGTLLNGPRKRPAKTLADAGN